jgi:tetratricopeptide (TPR) repeat protein
VAYVERARETGDYGYYDQADAALQNSLGRDSQNFEGLKAKAMILLGRRDFDKAIELARKLNTEIPDDVLVYGLLADGLTETGRYQEAVDRTQWMLNLRPGNVPGLLRAARLRWIYGRAEGALDLYQKAYEQVSPTQTEEQAWILTQMAEIQISSGHLDLAGELLHSALTIFPGYYLSLESSARLETARRNYSRAVDLLLQRNRNFPTPESRYQLARALECAGKAAEAKKAFDEFEAEAFRLRDTPRNANLQLSLYYLSVENRPSEALRIAASEANTLRDINTLDTLAWALCSNGQYREAQTQITAALATGVRDAGILYHAGVIAEKLQDNSSAAGFFKSSLEANPSSEVSEKAQRALTLATAVSVTGGTSH